jgi:FtsH-binding integral membrane protein
MQSFALEPQADYQSQSAEEYFDSQLRLGFIRKVLGLLSTQMFFTLAFIMVCASHTPIIEYMDDSLWIPLTIGIIEAVAVLLLLCFKSIAYKVPYNYALLALFTLCNATFAVKACAEADTEDVQLAVSMAAFLLVVFTLYSWSVSQEFRTRRAVVLTVAIVGMFFLLVMFASSEHFYHLLAVTVCVLCFGLFVVFDVQILATRSNYKLTYDDYIIATILVYFDVIRIFCKILARRR